MRYSSIAAALLVAGCQSTGMTTYGFKDGATVNQKSRDSFECEIDAAQEVPVNSQVRTTPAYITPMQTICSGRGCYTTGAQVLGGRTYSYDANKSLREEYFARCMTRRGYRTFRLPTCDSSSVSPGLKRKLAGKLRPPKEGACVSRVTERAGNIVYPEEVGE